MDSARYKGCREPLARQSSLSNQPFTMKEECKSNISLLCDHNFNVRKLSFPAFCNGLNNPIS